MNDPTFLILLHIIPCFMLLGAYLMRFWLRFRLHRMQRIAEEKDNSTKAWAAVMVSYELLNQ